MSSAETMHPIEWRDDRDNLQAAYIGEEQVGLIWRTVTGIWGAMIVRKNGVGLPADDFDFPTASAARSFVEKSVKEAGHGE